VDFVAKIGCGRWLAVSHSAMGELAAARTSTSVANIVVGRPMPAKTANRLRMLSPLIQVALSIAPFRRALGRDSGKPPIPTPEPKEGWRSQLVSRLPVSRRYLRESSPGLSSLRVLSAPNMF
jgi:hypothetical protein